MMTYDVPELLCSRRPVALRKVQHHMQFDSAKLMQQVERLRTTARSGTGIAAGEYTGRIVAVDQVDDSLGRKAARATFQIDGGAQAGRRIAAYLHGTAVGRLLAPGWQTRQFGFRVYVRQVDDGRAYARVDVETVREVDSGRSTPAAAPDCLPSASTMLSAVRGFTIGFAFVGQIGMRRSPVDWYEHFGSMAACSAAVPAGQPAFGSTYVFTEELLEHIAANDRIDEEHGRKPRGSLEGFKGKHYSPLLTFDIDRRDKADRPDLLAAGRDTTSLVVTLLEAGMPPDCIMVFFSGGKGFHVHVPSMLTGALPSEIFAAMAKDLCCHIAAQAGIAIDEAMYRPLQPLRAPNSRNEKSGLYKIRLDLDELFGLEIEEIVSLARGPRPFKPPSFVCEPLPAMVALWHQAAEATQRQATRWETTGRDGVEARLNRATWEFLINGAAEGQRATELFKAAANLTDFTSVESLARALLQRPAELSGLPQREAEGHIDGAMRRVRETQ